MLPLLPRRTTGINSVPILLRRRQRRRVSSLWEKDRNEVLSHPPPRMRMRAGAFRSFASSSRLSGLKSRNGGGEGEREGEGKGKVEEREKEKMKGKGNGKVIFSGIQPTGIPHLGNYLGALSNWVRLQDDADADTKLLFSVVDLHALTAVERGGELRKRSREMLAALLAVGLDEKKAVIFVQSQVPAHSELMWILSCTSSMGYLARMTQWKSKLHLSDTTSPLDENTKSKLKLGLLSYPVLQAADILVHRATHVPVGEDQAQHLEFARECATNFNAAYSPHISQPVLLHPTTLLSPTTKRIMSLTSPTQKMSKSHPSPSSRILITDSPETIAAKLRTAVTDSINSVTWDPERRPGVANLLGMLSAFDEHARTPEELARSMGGVGLGALKGFVGEAVAEGLKEVRGRWERLMGEVDKDGNGIGTGGGYLGEVERTGRDKARENAEETMVRVREAVGL